MKLLLATALLAPAIAFAQTEFKGIALGSEIAALEQQVPKPACEKHPGEPLGDVTCLVGIPAGICFLQRDQACIEKHKQFLEVAGVIAERMNFGYYDGKLASISIVVRHAAYDRLLAALSNKFGPVTSSESKPLTSGGGVTVVSTTTLWKRDDAVIVLTEYSNRITESNLSYMATDAAEEFSRRQEARKKRDAKNL